MKIYELFDNTDCPVDLTELAGVDMDASCNTDRILSLTRKKLGLKRRRPSSRRGLFFILAAAIAIGLLCTTAGATGVLENVFRNNVKPQSKSLSISCVPVTADNELYDIACEGITGDDSALNAVFTIRKKDGSPFTENTEGLSLDAFYDNEDKTGYFYYDKDSDEEKLLTRCYVVYKFDDNCTISAFAHMDGDQINTKRIKLVIPELKAWRFKEKLYPLKEKDVIWVKNADFNYVLPVLKEYEEAYAPLLKENEIIRWGHENRGLNIYEQETLTSLTRVYFEPAYDYPTRELISEPVTVSNDEISITFTEIRSGSNILHIKGEKIQGRKYYQYVDDLWVELADGRTVHLETGDAKFDFPNEDEPDKNITFEAECVYCERDDEFRLTPVDPDDIVHLYMKDLQIM